MTDPEIRSVLYPWWRQVHPDSLLVSEYGGARGVIADVAAFSKQEFQAYEIKSDQDSLRRLPAQLTAYATLFHRVTVVTGPRYAAKVEALVPEWVGLLLVDEEGQVKIVRAAGNNPMLPLAANALWVEEGRELCRTHCLRGYSGLTKWTMPPFIHERLPAAIIQAWTLHCLRGRYSKPFRPRGTEPITI